MIPDDDELSPKTGQINIKMSSALKTAWDGLEERNKSRLVRDAIRALVAGTQRQAAQGGDTEKLLRLQSVGVVDAVPDVLTRDFAPNLSRPKNVVVIVTDNLLGFLVAHRHLSWLQHRFERARHTAIYVSGPPSKHDPAVPDLTADNAHAVEKLMSAIFTDDALQKYLAARDSADLVAANDTRFEIVPYVPLSTSTPPFAFLDDNELHLSFPIINPVAVEPFDRRALVIKTDTEGKMDTLWLQLMTLPQGLPAYRNLVAERLVDEGHLTVAPAP